MKNDVKNHNKPIQGKDFEEWVEERARLIVENLYMYKKDKKPHYIPSPSEQKHYKIKLDIAEDFIRQLTKELKPRVSKEKIFVQHIENHLKTMGIKGKVVCKICGKDIDTIADKEVIE